MTPPVERDEELITAYLDDEVTPEERAFVDAWLTEDPHARELHDELAAVRRQLRALPEVTPPFGFYERIHLESRKAGGRARSVIGAIAAIAAVLSFTVAVGPVAEAMVPPVHDMMVRHQDLAEGKVDVAMPMAPVSMSDADAMGGVPAMPTLMDVPRARVFVEGTTAQVVFGAGDQIVSVYEVPGIVRWADLPATGSRMKVGPEDAWAIQDGALAAVVVQHGRAVLVVVAEGTTTGVGTATGMAIPPAPAPSFVDRLSDTVDAVADQFSW